MQFQKHQQALAVGHAQANRLAGRVADAARNLLGGIQDEGVGAGRAEFEDAELVVVHHGVAGQLRKVTAQQCEHALLIDLADAAQPVDHLLVVQLADKGVAGVGGHGQNASVLEHGRSLLEQARLGIVGVNFKVLGHGGTPGRELFLLLS
ncbi:hypothetical protein D3C72_1235690 [compost metagenome]